MTIKRSPLFTVLISTAFFIVSLGALMTENLILGLILHLCGLGWLIAGKVYGE